MNQPPFPGHAHPGYPPGPPGYGGQGYGQRQPAPKKKMSGCLLALLITSALFLVTATGAGIWAYLEYGEYIGAAGDATKIILEAQSAPGTDELKELGCSEALVLDVEEFSKVAQRVEDEMAKREGRRANPVSLEKGAAYFVQCNLGITSDEVTCDQAAKAFVKAIKPHNNIIVSVQGKSGRDKCSKSYDKTGAPLGDATAPRLPK